MHFSEPHLTRTEGIELSILKMLMLLLLSSPLYGRRALADKRGETAYAYVVYVVCLVELEPLPSFLPNASCFVKSC